MIEVCVLDEIFWYENYDLENIVTPVDADMLKQLLEETNYDKDEINFLYRGFTQGFSLGYQGPQKRRTFARNHRLRAGNKTILWNKLMTEVKLKRVAGPWRLSELPFDDMIQSPITLIKKKGQESLSGVDGTRLIFDLSYPRGDSLNDHTPKEVRSCEYPLFDKTILMCLKEGKGCYLSSTDAKSVFKQLPLATDQFKWVVMMCEHPCSGEKFYFCDKTVCFGSGTSCFLYMKLSNALAHIFRAYTEETEGDINNFLDDFQMCKADQEGCNNYLGIFVQICDKIGLPLSDDKTVFATQVAVFLGLLINTVTQTVSLPLDKIMRGQRELDIISRSRKITVRDLQKLTGLLNFFCRAIVPGRAFTRRLYAKIGNLKPHYHIRVNAEMRLDLEVWSQFLTMSEAVSRPFLDFRSLLHADRLDYYTDAALDGTRLGIGGRFGNSWFAGIHRFTDGERLQDLLTIQIAELYSIFISLYMWMKHLKNRRVVIFTDNQSVMYMINKSTSSCPVCMIMIRLITLWSMRYNTRIFCWHIQTELNESADLLSRGEIKGFLEKFPGTQDHQQLLPDRYWPIPECWFNN